MAAAAANLTPLTLELGGKSPAIVCADFPIRQAAARLATGKWFNAGQTCIAPDYVLVDGERRDALVEALRREVAQRYARDAGSDYTHVASDAQLARLGGYLDDARQRGLEVITLAETGGARAMPPIVVLQPDGDAELMRHEIFGPILPVIGYATLEEAIGRVAAGDRPLALYPFSRDRATVERILRHTLAGGVTVNDTLLHSTAGELPFGGVGASGMGAYRGRAGFDAMSKALPILWQRRRAASDRLRPPYAKVERLIRILVR